MVPFSPFPFMFLFAFVFYHVSLTVWMGSNKLDWTELNVIVHSFIIINCAVVFALCQNWWPATSCLLIIRFCATSRRLTGNQCLAAGRPRSSLPTTRTSFNEDVSFRPRVTLLSCDDSSPNFLYSPPSAFVQLHAHFSNQGPDSQTLS